MIHIDRKCFNKITRTNHVQTIGDDFRVQGRDDIEISMSQIKFFFQNEHVKTYVYAEKGRHLKLNYLQSVIRKIFKNWITTIELDQGIVFSYGTINFNLSFIRHDIELTYRIDENNIFLTQYDITENYSNFLYDNPHFIR